MGRLSNETAAIFNIPSPAIILEWKMQFETQGVDALKSKKKGRPSMKKESINNQNKHQLKDLLKHYKQK